MNRKILFSLIIISLLCLVKFIYKEPHKEARTIFPQRRNYYEVIKLPIKEKNQFLFLFLDNSQPILLDFDTTRGFTLADNNTFAEIKFIHPRNWAFPDYNGDGMRDLVIADHGADTPPYSGGKLYFFKQTNKHEFILDKDIYKENETHFYFDLCAKDINMDGLDDLYVADIGLANSPGYFLINQKGKKYLKDNSYLNLNRNFLSCHFLDYNGDSYPDLILSNHDGVARSRGYDEILINNQHTFYSTKKLLYPNDEADWGASEIITLRNDSSLIITIVHNPASKLSQGGVHIYKKIKNTYKLVKTIKTQNRIWISRYLIDYNRNKIIFLLRPATKNLPIQNIDSTLTLNLSTLAFSSQKTKLKFGAFEVIESEKKYQLFLNYDGSYEIEQLDAARKNY